MTHKLRTFSQALAAALALGAVAASAASAFPEFTGDSFATITGTQISGLITSKETNKPEFTTRAGTVKCNKVSLDGSMTFSESPEQTLTPTYSECTLAGVVPLDIATNSCDFLITTVNTVGESPNRITAGLDIKCSSLGDKIVMTATGPNCVITIPPQSSPITGMELHNKGGAGSTMDVEATIDLFGLTHEIHGNACPNSPFPTTLYSDGFYRGLWTLQSNGVHGFTIH